MQRHALSTVYCMAASVASRINVRPTRVVSPQVVALEQNPSRFLQTVSLCTALGFSRCVHFLQAMHTLMATSLRAVLEILQPRQALESAGTAWCGCRAQFAALARATSLYTLGQRRSNGFLYTGMHTGGLSSTGTEPQHCVPQGAIRHCSMLTITAQVDCAQAATFAAADDDVWGPALGHVGACPAPAERALIPINTAQTEMCVHSWSAVHVCMSDLQKHEQPLRHDKAPASIDLCWQPAKT